MMASPPTPLKSFLGGLCLPVSMHALLVLNGNVLGVSGLLHRTVRGNLDALSGVGGLVAGGMLGALLQPVSGPPISHVGLPQTLAAGLLVGLGTKMANGCTSGHMLAGLARFSKRSFAATCTFVGTAGMVARIIYSGLPHAYEADRTLGDNGVQLLALQLIPLSVEIYSYIFAAPTATARRIVFLTTGLHFALGLQLSGLVDPMKVLAFLVTPLHDGFDPSLAFLALGALPLGTLLYQVYGKDAQPKLANVSSIPRPGEIDTKLLFGSVLFGIGWGISGLCPAPALINLGNSLISHKGFHSNVVWLLGFIAGGLVAPR